MFSSPDYTKMTLEELLSEEKKMKSGRISTAVFIGFLIGIAVYAASHKSFLLPVFLMIIAFRIGYKHSENLKNIQAEISRKNPTGGTFAE